MRLVSHFSVCIDPVTEKKQEIVVDFHPGEYANKTMGFYQKKFIRRNKEVVINFPLARDDDDDEPPKHDPKAIGTWIYPSNYDQRYEIKKACSDAAKRLPK